MAYTYPYVKQGSTGEYWSPATGDIATVGAGFQFAGLGGAQAYANRLAERGGVAYPTAPTLQGPVDTGFYDYTPSSALQRIESPDYRLLQGEGAIQSGYTGLMGGDYARFEQALYDPAAAAATRAYQQSRADLETAMAARGLYGGSEFARQMTENVARPYQETLASAAATATQQRYAMEQQDLMAREQFAQSAMQMGLSREQAYNQWELQKTAQQQQQEYDVWRTGMAETERQQTYAQQQWQTQAANRQAQIDFQNQQAMLQYQNAVAARAGGLAEEEAAYNRYLALAGYGAPMTQAGLSYQSAMQQAAAMQEAAAKQSSAATWGALAGVGGSIAGGLLGNWGEIFGGGSSTQTPITDYSYLGSPYGANAYEQGMAMNYGTNAGYLF